MKKLWKKVCAAFCTAALLMTAPGITVLAGDLQSEQLQDADLLTEDASLTAGETISDDIAVVNEKNENQAVEDYAEGEVNDNQNDEDFGIIDASASEENDVTESPAAEETESTDSRVTEEDESSDDLTSDETEIIDPEIDKAIESADDSSTEENVGLSWAILQDYPLTTGLTVTVYYSGYTLVDEAISSCSVTFKSKNATLPYNWQSLINKALVSNGYPEWKTMVTWIGFDTTEGTCYLPENCKNLFAGLTAVKNIELSNVNTSKVKYTNSMFEDCAALENIDFGNFNTSNVINMSAMFNGCKGLKQIDLSSFNTSKVTDMSYMFCQNETLTNLNVSNFNTSAVKNMAYMFSGCYKLKSLNLSSFNTSNVTDMSGMFGLCSKISELNLTGFNTRKVKNMDYMFNNCYGLKKLDLSSFELTSIQYSNGSHVDGILFYCNALEYLKTPKENKFKVPFGALEFDLTMYDAQSNSYTALPIRSGSIVLRNKKFNLKDADISGVSISYGYTGKAYEPAFTIFIDDVTLKAGTDYTYKFENNVGPGTATITVTGKGNYTGTFIRTFEIVKCVSQIVSGKTYQLIPKNNPKTIVCPEKGGVIDNTRVYITNPSTSEAMRFVAVKQSDGTWKFINAKCELALAVQQNSKELNKELVLYKQTEKAAQNWNMVKKSDNSFAIINSVSGLSVEVANSTAKAGTRLKMAATKSSGLQRFYLVETAKVNAVFDAVGYVRASKDSSFVLNVSGASKSEGANINLNKFSASPSKLFKFTYSGSGYYRIENAYSGMVLTISGNTAKDGANVIQAPWKGLKGQLWKVEKNPKGSLTMTSGFGTVLHINGNKMASGTNVLVRNPSATTAQQWLLTKK